MLEFDGFFYTLTSLLNAIFLLWLKNLWFLKAIYISQL